MIRKIMAFLPMLALFSCGTLFMNVEGEYYYAAWGTAPDATGCMNYDSNADKISDASMKTVLKLAANTMTLTRSLYSALDCNTLDGQVVATTSYSLGNPVSSFIIKKDIITAVFSLWSAEPVIAVEMDLSYSKAELTCKTASCVTSFHAVITAAGCSTGALSVNTVYDYTGCQFAGQPRPLYSIAYKNAFDELLFGNDYAFDSDGVASFPGDTAANRYRYLLINEKFILLKR